MWEKVDRRSNTIMLRGGAPAENLNNIFKASEFAKKIGKTKKDGEWAFVTFCVQFTTTSLLETMQALDTQEGDDAPA